MHYYCTKYQKRVYYNIHNTSSDKVELKYNYNGPSLNSDIDIVISNFYNRDQCSLLCQEIRSPLDFKTILPPLIPSDLNEFTKFSLSFR